MSVVGMRLHNRVTDETGTVIAYGLARVGFWLLVIVDGSQELGEWSSDRCSVLVSEPPP